MEPCKGARAALAISCFLPFVALASSEAVTEADAIQIFLEESPQARAIPLAIRSRLAESRIDTRIANPNVAYQIEDAFGVRDEFLTFQQELPITGRRGLLRERAEAASSAVGLVGERDLQQDAYALKFAFHAVLYRETVLGSLRQGAQTLMRTVEVLRERERQGESAGYDVLRAEQELAELQIAAFQAEAALVAARFEFGSFFGAARGMESATLAGGFTTADSAPEAGEAVELALSKRSDLRALSAQAERQELDYRAARRRRFPEPTLTAGWKRVEALGISDTGFVASLMVPLPFFERGQYEAARATAEHGRVELRAEVLERQIRAEVHAAVGRDRSARDVARRYGQQVESRSIELRRIAQLAYDEGESGILELLDAHRTALAMELRALAARYEAKTAEIDLNRAIGIEVKP